MEGIEFLEDDVISILETKGIRSIEDLGDYKGDDNLVLQLQFLVEKRLKKLIRKLDDVKKGPVIGKITDSVYRISSENNVHHLVSKKEIELSHDRKNKSGNELTSLDNQTDLPSKNLRLSEVSLRKIDLICDSFIKLKPDKGPISLLEDMLISITPGIIQEEIKVENIDIITIFEEAADLAGVINTFDFKSNLKEMQSEWAKTDNKDVIIKNCIHHLTETADKFTYNELFYRLLERKIHRVTSRKGK